MPDGGNTRRRNCRNRWKREWYAIYRSARFRSRFGNFQRSRNAVIEIASEYFRSSLAEGTKVLARTS
jgi:hypothetical protein